MKTFRRLVLVPAFLLACGAQAFPFFQRENVILWDAGTPPCPVVIRTNATPEERQAAQKLTNYLSRMSGGAAFPIGPHLDRVARLPIRTNYAVLVGCNAARNRTLREERAATPAELERMCSLVREGFEDGAIGLSSGVAYTPFLTTEELAAMARVALRFDLPQPVAEEPAAPQAPGMNPDKPPVLR